MFIVFFLMEAHCVLARGAQAPVLERGMYVIVGVFKQQSNADRFAELAGTRGISPSVGLRRSNGMYYVYAYSTQDDLAAARAMRSKLRAGAFRDAWILYIDMPVPQEEQQQQQEDDEFQELRDVSSGLPPARVNGNGNMNKSAQPAAPARVVEVQAIEEVVAKEAATPDVNAFPFVFNVINATTLKEVPGYVGIVDAARNKVIQSVSTNDEVMVEAPGTATNKVLAICDIFGYVKQQVEFDVTNPLSSADAAMMNKEGETTQVFFELARHNVGEVLTMYNVYFYNDAAIMKPESIFELNSLLSMLQENDELVIKIHGHTNGSAAGKIISLKDDDTNFFEVTANNKEGFGSAKDLSKSRAEAIKRWLVEKGIDEKRMELKGWGGKQMIYNKGDEMAGRNVRVEIELLKG